MKGALESQQDEGYWLDEDEISADLFVKHLNAMASYVRASQRASRTATEG